MKLCIELDEESQKRWNWIKEDLEDTFEYVHEKPVPIADSIVFECLLYCYEEGNNESFPIHFADSVSEEEIASMSQRKSNS
jgi:hypothetical protein